MPNSNIFFNSIDRSSLMKTWNGKPVLLFSSNVKGKSYFHHSLTNGANIWTCVYTSFSFAFLCFIFTLGSINCLQLNIVKVQSACASPGLVFIQVTILSFNLYKTIYNSSIFLYQDYKGISIKYQLTNQTSFDIPSIRHFIFTNQNNLIRHIHVSYC